MLIDNYEKFIEVVNGLTEEGRGRFLAEVFKEAKMSDIVDGLYMQKTAEEQDELPDQYSKVFPRVATGFGLALLPALALGLSAGPAFNKLVNSKSNMLGRMADKMPNFAKKGLTKKLLLEEDTINAAKQAIVDKMKAQGRNIDINDVQMDLKKYVNDHWDEIKSGSKKVRQEVLRNALGRHTEDVRRMGHASISGIPGLVSAGIMGSEYMKNVRKHNEDRDRITQLEERLNSKRASHFIDEIYKMATITVPSKDEAKKETKLSKDNREDIECEVCEYKGKVTPKGECPECGTLGGLMPKDRNVRELPENKKEPFSGISLAEADALGRLEDVW
jgi:hypothetical protein